MTNDPIFIVGTPRSGTTLLAAMLASHSRIDCGPETHFFAECNLSLINSIISDKRWPRKAVNFLLSLHLEGKNTIELFEISPEEAYSFLSEKPRSLNSVLEALTELHMRKAKKVRWAEKTPRHLLHVKTIRNLYPKSPIIKIVRDPRDVALSLKRVPWASNSLVSNIFRWLSDEEASQSFFKTDSRSLIVKYETLIRFPKHELKRICDFIEEDFEPQMLTPGESARNLIGKGEWWKKNITGSIDPSRVDVWKREMPDHYARVASCICYDLLKRYGYETTCVPKQTIALSHLTAKFIEKNEDFFIHAANNCIKITGYPDLPDAFIKQTLKTDKIIFIGIPGQDGWNLGVTSRERLLNISILAIKLITYRLNNVPVFWYPYKGQAKLAGKADRFCYMLLSSFANRVTGSLDSILQDYIDAQDQNC